MVTQFFLRKIDSKTAINVNEQRDKWLQKRAWGQNDNKMGVGTNGSKNDPGEKW